MATEFWRTDKIGDLPIQLVDGDRSSRYPKRSEFVSKGIIFLNADSVSTGKLDVSKVNHIPYSKFATITKGRLQRDDIVVTMRGNGVGKAARYDLASPGFINAQMLIMRADASRIDPTYLYYYWISPRFQDELKGYVSGSAQPQLTMTHLNHIPISYPSLPEQRAIAHVLGALDDKIELNRRMNATLEALARAIFQSWFVDFDPVHAKARGEQPAGMDAATAALFPDRFEDSELGAIPKGWGAGPLSRVIEIIGGGTPKTSEPEYWDGDIPWFSVKDVPFAGDVYVIDTEKKITEKGLANSSTRILPEGTTIITARGTVGKLALVGAPMAMNQSCYGVQGGDGYPPLFNYFQLQSVLEMLKQQTHGSVFDTITRDTFETIRVPVVPPELAQRYDCISEPFLERIQSNLLESWTLSDIRDELLPSLMSGAIRV